MCCKACIVHILTMEGSDPKSSDELEHRRGNREALLLQEEVSRVSTKCGGFTWPDLQHFLGVTVRASHVASPPPQPEPESA
jgi:hypothetical protein